MSHLRVYRTVYGIHIPDKVLFMSITDKVRYIRITDKVRYTRNTDFVYNGHKTLVPTGTLYARFTVSVCVCVRACGLKQKRGYSVVCLFIYLHILINPVATVRSSTGHLHHWVISFSSQAISRSSQCSTTGVTKAVVCAILSVGWCI